MVWVVVSLVLGVLPLLGIAGLLINGLLFTVDGLFMSLILLATSGIFLQNALAGVRRVRSAKTAEPAAEPLKVAQAAAATQKGS